MSPNQTKTHSLFTTDEKETFATRGLIKRKNFLPVEKLAAARKLILRHLEQEGLWRNGEWQPEKYGRSVSHSDSAALLKPLWRHQTIIDLASDEAPIAASALVNNGKVVPMSPHPALLFTLPNAAEWTLPHKGWHLDRV